MRFIEAATPELPYPNSLVLLSYVDFAPELCHTIFTFAKLERKSERQPHRLALFLLPKLFFA